MTERCGGEGVKLDLFYLFVLKAKKVLHAIKGSDMILGLLNRFTVAEISWSE